MKKILKVAISILVLVLMFNPNPVKAEDGVIRTDEYGSSWYCIGEGYDSNPGGSTVYIDGMYYVYSTGWQKIDGKWYCFDDAMVTGGMHYYGSNQYYFDESGVMQTGWIKEQVTGDDYSYTNWYYANSNGVSCRWM